MPTQADIHAPTSPTQAHTDQHWLHTGPGQECIWNPCTIIIASNTSHGALQQNEHAHTDPQAHTCPHTGTHRPTPHMPTQAATHAPTSPTQAHIDPHWLHTGPDTYFHRHTTEHIITDFHRHTTGHIITGVIAVQFMCSAHHLGM